MTEGDKKAGRFPWWVVLGGVLLGLVYLPMLGARFDFVDDGDLVYPTGPLSAPEQLAHVWQRIESNYQHLGPFRPFLHAYWEAEVELVGAHEVRWRGARLAWAMVAGGCFLWLLRELGVRPVAALLAGALMLWNPYRNEVWHSLTLSEGVAMPFAVLALICAVRGARSRRPWPWDLAGALAVLSALGCKNTFAALVPAQVALRMLPAGVGWREGCRRNGWRALLLATTLLLPIGHYVYFKLHWHPGQYTTRPPSLSFLLGYLRSLAGAISIDFMGAGLALALVAVAVGGRLDRDGWMRWRAPLVAGLLLLLGGTVVYLPIGSLSGRYTMPAVWGLDLLLAVLFSLLAGGGAVRLRRAAYVALGCGLLAVLAANVGKQDKLKSRWTLLWQVLERVEREAPPGARIGWLTGPDLDTEEGIHFAWHLRGRGRRRDLQVVLLTEDGAPLARVEMPARPGPLDLLVSGARAGPAAPPAGGPWANVVEFTTTFWAKKRCRHCYLWERTSTGLAGRGGL
jgi:hypothetical protein